MPHILVATLAYSDYIYIHYEKQERTRSEEFIFTSVKNQNLFFGSIFPVLIANPISF